MSFPEGCVWAQTGVVGLSMQRPRGPFPHREQPVDEDRPESRSLVRGQYSAKDRR